MAQSERPNVAIQEDCLTLLCHNDEAGRIVAQLLDPALFEGEYRTIADKAVDYWRRHDEAPKMHTADLVGDIISNPQNRRGSIVKRILHSMAMIAEEINTDYVLDQLRRFTRLQQMKSAILQSAEKLNAQQDLAIEDVEVMWSEILRTRYIDFHPGYRLHDVKVMLAYLKARDEEFRIGIPELDLRNVVPSRGTIMLFLGGAGRGKTWFLVNCGKQALLQRKRVVHITLELSAPQTLQRYYQALFSVAKRDTNEGIDLTTLETDSENTLTGFGTDNVQPQFTFDSDGIKTELEAHTGLITGDPDRYRNLIVKQFPSKQLTTSVIRGYLDNLEVTEKFIPDMLIVDYLKEMKTDTAHYRLDIGNTFSELRGLGVERNMAVVTAQQLSKAGVLAAQAGATHVAEDWGLIGTADTVLTYSCTDLEFQHGLGRIYVSKCRDEEDRFGVLLTQNYKIGQFALESMYLSKEYFDHLEHLEDQALVSDAEYDKNEDGNADEEVD